MKFRCVSLLILCIACVSVRVLAYIGYFPATFCDFSKHFNSQVPHRPRSSGKSGPKDQVALHYSYTSPSHWCTRYRNCKFHNGCPISRHADGISRYSVPPSAGPLLPLPRSLLQVVSECVNIFYHSNMTVLLLRIALHQPPSPSARQCESRTARI